VVRLTDEHITRARKIARWYARRVPSADVSDLESAALEGLAKAARDFDPHGHPTRKGPRIPRRRAFWCFAFNRIVGEMKDELRRLDHLTRNQRALVVEDGNGQLAVEQDDLSWINPEQPLPLDATIRQPDGSETTPIVDFVEEPHDPIENFELRDAFLRAGADLGERQRFVVVKREIEGYSNSELADAFEVTEGRASQLRGAALDRMREQIGDAFVDAA
jgi:RNA polymerase sigma factor (sigma-70 family)